MALIFSEEFETTVGVAPVGWTTDTGGAPVVSTDGYHAHGCNISFASARKALGGSITAGSIFFALKGNGVLTGLQQTVVGTTTQYLPVFTITVNPDSSVGCYDGGGNLACEGINSFDSRGNKADGAGDEWTFIQADITIGTSTAFGTGGGMAVACALRISGELVAQGTSAGFATSLGTYVDQLKISETLPVTSVIDSIYCYDAIATTPIVTPNQGTAIHARISQAVLEYLDLDISVARVSQGAVEYTELPNSAAARVSQAVIELLLLAGGGWRCYEA